MIKPVELVSELPEPPISKLLFANTRFAAFWLVIRVYIGWQWLLAGWEKIINPVWFGTSAGMALHGFLLGSLKKTVGTHPDVSGWYALFLRTFVLSHTTLFSNLVSLGELAVGIGLILGIFTGMASFFGAFMNMNYLFAGTVSTNPIMFLCELLLILAWRVAGWYGIDRFLLPYLGTPWKPGSKFRKK